MRYPSISLFLLFYKFFFKIYGTNVAFLTNDPSYSTACSTAIGHANSVGQCAQDFILKIADACKVDNEALGTVNACDLVYDQEAKLVIGPECFDENFDISVLSYHWKVPLFSRNGLLWFNINNTLNPTIIQTTYLNSVLYSNSLSLFMDTFNLTSVMFLGPASRNGHHISLHKVIAEYFQNYYTDKVTNIISLNESIISSYSPGDVGLISYTKLIVIDADFDNLNKVMQQMELLTLYNNGYIFILLCSQHSSVCTGNDNKYIEECNMVILGPYFENYTNINNLMTNYFNNYYNPLKGIEYLTSYISCYAMCVASKLSNNYDGTSIANTVKGKSFTSLLGSYTFDQMPSLLLKQSFSQYNKNNNGYVDLIITTPTASSCDKNKCFELNIVINDRTFWSQQLISPLTHCFLFKNCTNYLVIVLCVVGGVIVVGFFVTMYIVRRRRRLNQYRMNWKIPKEQFKVIENKVSNSKNKQGSSMEPLTSKRRQIFAYALVDTTKAEFLQLKQIKKISWSKPEIKFIAELKKISHDNLTNFLGVNYNDSDKFYILSALIDRASLEDLVDNVEFNLDMTFKSAFIRDILKGLQYLHKSHIGYHGLLNIKTCLIDANWVLKLSCFGITNILHNLIHDEVLKTIELIGLQFYQTISPENLKNCTFGTNYPMGSPSGDIYSFGIILYQLTYRHGPFDGLNMILKDILKEIVDKGLQPVFEATLEEDPLLDLMKDCFKYDPLTRPTLKILNNSIKTIFHATSGNLVDQMMSMNEKYAQNLERVIAERTNLLIEAQEQIDRLLSEMLPPSIAETLKNGGKVEPKLYESATVCFVQIWEFAKFMEDSSPPEVVQFLNDVFNMFDEVISSHDCYKVETIGDTYMVVSGVPKENKGKHVFVIAEVALSLRSHSLVFKVPVRPEWKLTIRIGFHCGPIAAGIIGLKAPRYCLFGDTVNFASRMESNSPPNQIQVSEPTALKLMENPEYRLIKRGIVKVKGKGDVNTYWLNEHFHHDEPPPDPKPIS
uniref:Guanylate cyclase n=1 Tax=Parastrongyloides trichosuri TaxID=131310 RepID=A0A0N4ZT33_PARTI